MIGGKFRFVCANGLVLGDVAADQKVHHSGRGDVVNDVIEGAFEVLKHFEQIDHMTADKPQARLVAGLRIVGTGFCVLKFEWIWAMKSRAELNRHITNDVRTLDRYQLSLEEGITAEIFGDPDNGCYEWRLEQYHSSREHQYAEFIAGLLNYRGEMVEPDIAEWLVHDSTWVQYSKEVNLRQMHLDIPKIINRELGVEIKPSSSGGIPYNAFPLKAFIGCMTSEHYLDLLDSGRAQEMLRVKVGQIRGYE